MSQPFTPDLAAMRGFLTSRPSAGTHLDMDVTRFDADGIELTMPITDKCRQPFGLLHGGMSLVLAESAASMHSCWGVDLSEVSPVGVEINGSHLRSAREGTVRAVGRVLRRTRSLVVHEVEVSHVESGDLLCVSRVTNFLKRNAPAA